jgi:parallel beta-helix repeat protein
MRSIAWVLLATIAGNAAPLTLHVARSGNDNASGRIEAPLASLPGALKAARQRRAPGQPVSILLHSGTFVLTEPLQLGPSDSDTTIAAFETDKPIISGGHRITGWKNIRSNLWQTAIPADDVHNWFYFRQLFIDGRRATVARTPNEGSFFRMVGERFSDKPVQFRFRPGDIKPEWRTNELKPEVVGFEKWTVFRQFIWQASTESNVVRLSGNAAPHTREAGAQYYIQNFSEALDAPGEWFFDYRNRLVNYLARPGEDLSKAEFIAPHLEELVIIQGDAAAQKPVERITFRGITFSYADWTITSEGYVDTQAAVARRGALRAEFARNLSIEDCTFSHLGNYAVELGRGTQNCRVVGNEMTDIGAGGIRIGETTVRADGFDATHHNTVTDNHIHDLGIVFPPAVGVLILQSAHNRVAHNHIHDLFYTAVSVGWTWGYRESPCHHNVIEFNHMHDLGKSVLSDLGAVYTLGPQPGSVVRNNLIHDVSAYTYGGWGLYTDEGSTGIVLENNIVYGCKSAGFHQHYGKENVIRNNVLAFNKENELMRSREEDHISFYFTNNIVMFGSGNLLGSTWKNDRFVMENNLYWDVRAGTNPAKLKFIGATLPQWRARGHDTNSIIADPLFVDASKFDFHLQKGAPALKHGFKPIDLSSVGVRAKEKRD